jgi:TolB-like protein/class 3 adenylate cyclase
MKPERTDTLRLSAVVFTDIVGYSAVVHRDPALGARLLDRQRRVVRDCVPRFGGREIETAGDSFLLEFDSALAALQCIADIQQRLDETNRNSAPAERVQLRASIHLGDVEHRGKEIFGDGVNVAARLLPFSPEGGVAFSDVVNRQVQSRLNVPTRSIGRHPLKNIAQAAHIFTLDAAALATLQTSSIPRLGAVRRWATPRVAAAVAAVVLGTAAIAVWTSRGGREAAAGVMSDKSVAVLPFANLSAEADSQYFTDGLHDSVITHMAGVQDLKVISRTSVMRYREGTRNLREIAADLGVAHIVEGSVQRAGSRLHVNAQLIKTSTDTHVWATQYNRDISDVFAVQAELAEQITQAVHARLTPAEKARIERPPTTSPAAYELYLKAVAASRSLDAGPVEFEQGIRQLEQAVALDSNFALAYALLSALHDRLYWYAFDRSARRLAGTRDAAATALRLNPDLAEAHIAQAIYLYHGSRDYAAAIRELEEARRIAPHHGEVHTWLGYIQRRQGRWDEALRGMEIAMELDPRNEQIQSEYASTLRNLHRYAEADRIYARLGSSGIPSSAVAVPRAFLHMEWTGDLDRLERAVQDLPREPDPGCGVAGARSWLKVLRRQFADAAAAILACPDNNVSWEEAGVVPKEFHAADAYHLAGDRERATLYYRQARPKLEALVAAGEDLIAPRFALAMTLAALGQQRHAAAEVERALASMPLSRDAIMGALALELAAWFHARFGEPERALDELERALSLPNGVSAHTVQLDPAFDALRGHSRYRQLIARHLPK